MIRLTPMMPPVRLATPVRQMVRFGDADTRHLSKSKPSQATVRLEDSLRVQREQRFPNSADTQVPKLAKEIRGTGRNPFRTGDQQNNG